MSTPANNNRDINTDYSIQELGQMMFDMSSRMANCEKKSMSDQFKQEAFARQQTQVNKNLDDTMTKLLTAVEKLSKDPPNDSPAKATSTRGWKLPPSHTTKPATFDPETWPKLKFDPPRFTGDNVNLWIKRIQKFYNHTFTPLADRLYLTEFLMDDSAAEWFGYWEANNEGKSWDEFLMDAKLRFDPDIYEDYVGRLANLRQTGPLDDYLTEFEPILQKVGTVGDDTLTSLFVAGLSAPLRSELLTRRPASLSDALALAQQLAACHAMSATSALPDRSTTSSRDSRTSGKSVQHHTKALEHPRINNPIVNRQPREDRHPRDFPVVRISPTERAEKRKRNECYWCPEKYSREHVCAKKFYALMGEESEDEDTDIPADEKSEDDAENMVITGDVSSIHVIGPKLRPRSIRITAKVHDKPVSVLIDGGSTHNFIKPAVAEQLSLPVHSVSPFRVFVGNGASLRCNYACLSTPISLQGHIFDIDLFFLQVEGPDFGCPMVTRFG